MRRTTVIRPVALVACLVLLASGCDRGVPSMRPAPSASEAAAHPPPNAAALPIDALLDPASRDLLTTIDPAEAIVATLTMQHPEPVVAAARDRGLTAEVVADDIVVVDGPLAPVLAFATDVHPDSVGLGEDPSVDRWLPAERPIVAIPAPGRPYLKEPMVADLSGLAMAEERRVPMLRSFASAVETIDGRPYARLQISGSCDPEEPGPVCTLYTAGSVVGSGDRQDERSMRGDARTGWRGVEVDGTVYLGAVPRALVRSAEWTARHDPAAATALGAYDTCCGAQWDPARPGQIALYYSRPCSEAIAPFDREIAATGDCFDGLVITVDVRGGSVLAIVPHPGP